jgi:hypothetical protein
MDANSTYFTLASIMVAVMILFGLGVLFVRAAKIERNLMVGLFTIGTSLIAAFILRSQIGHTDLFTPGQMWSVMLLSVFGFAVGLVYDRIAGPRPMPSRDEREATLGADLAD